MAENSMEIGDRGASPNGGAPTGVEAEAMSDRSRWIALYVLCAGVLMIVLDATVVNVALPSIQDDLGFSQSSLAWVVNAYLIAFGGLLLLAGRLGDLISRRGVFLTGLLVFTRLVAVLRPRPERCDARDRPILRRRRRRDDRRRGPGDDRDDVPGAAGAGEGDRRLRVRRLGRRIRRPARRRGADAGAELALDLLHQHPDRDRHRHPHPEAARPGQGDRVRRGRRRPRRDPDHRLPDARRLHDRRARGHRRMGSHRRRWRSAPARWCCSPPSSSARRPLRTPWCRCGSSAPATSPAPT